ncbi:MAG: methyltransferase domain-containing protein [Pseudomonadota bacterium]
MEKTSTTITRKDFFNQLAPDWDRRFYTPELKEHLKSLLADFHLKKGTRVLDVGSGTGGIIPYILQNIGQEGSVWAIDFAEEMVRLGKEKFPQEPRVIFQTASVESLPFADQFFDHIVCFGVWPHIIDKLLALKQIERVLKIGGTLIIAHALSSQEIKDHHKGSSPVSMDCLPEEAEMRSLLTSTGFQVTRLIDRPKYYLCEGFKTDKP